jgi:hypothetical protein
VLLAAGQPLRHGLEHGAQKGKGGPRRIQVVEPAAQGGGVGNAIRIFERRRSIFPRAPLHKAPPQRLAARDDQTVMGVRQGESGQETKDYTAQRTEPTAVPDPIVTLIMGLLPSPAMADDRVQQAERTPAKNQSSTGRPIESGLAMVGKKWNNVDRIVLRGSLIERNLARICAQKRAFSFLLDLKLQKDNSHCNATEDWPVNCRSFMLLAVSGVLVAHLSWCLLAVSTQH